MAAVLGGTQSLHTNSFDEAVALPTDFSARIARNTQLILAEESGITNVADPLGGSYYVEALTKELADKAWALIEEVEALGGMTAAVAERHAQAPDRGGRRRPRRPGRPRRGRDRRRQPLPAKDEEDHLDILDSRQCQGPRRPDRAAREDPRRAATRRRPQAALDALREGAQGDANLLALSVEAARARCTLGEISRRWRMCSAATARCRRRCSGIYGGAYDGRSGAGRAPRTASARSAAGSAASRACWSPRWARTATTAAPTSSPPPSPISASRSSPARSSRRPRKAPRLAVEKDVDVVGASSLAAGHKTLVPELIGHLRDLGRPDIKVVVGGVIPPQDYDMLREAGVQAIFGPGTNLVEAAGEVLKLLGHNCRRSRRPRNDRGRTRRSPSSCSPGRCRRRAADQAVRRGWMLTLSMPRR